MAARKEYERELKELHSHMIQLGSAVEKALDESSKALLNYDEDICEAVIRGDDEIDEMVDNIDRECVLLIARQQPVARDLRDITANLKLITDLERMADHAEDICSHVLRMLEKNQCIPVPESIIRLIDACRNMTGRALEAYVSRSREKAVQVLAMDDRVDEIYHALRGELIAEMRKNPSSLEGYVEMMMISKHVERYADHAENVAEWVIYYLDGKFDIHEHDIEKG